MYIHVFLKVPEMQWTASCENLLLCDMALTGHDEASVFTLVANPTPNQQDSLLYCIVSTSLTALPGARVAVWWEERLIGFPLGAQVGGPGLC